MVASTTFAADKPKNIVLILADDVGYGDIGCYGASKVRTPEIDKLAEEGRRFTDAHSASAVCSPSRYALMTGRYPFRNERMWGPLMLRDPLAIETDCYTLADVFKDADYATACIGKWHLGFGDVKPVDWNKPLSPGPRDLGFDYYFGVPVVNSHPPFVYVENEGVVGIVADDPFVYGKRAETHEYPEKMGIDVIGGARVAHEIYDDEAVGTTLAEKAVGWMKQQHTAGRPFFLYLATTNIHHPFTPAKRFQGTSECGRYGDCIHELDWIVGEVLRTLDEMGAANDTLVVFTSDNGGMLNLGGQDAWKLGHHMNGDLLGWKFDAWEGGHRVPMIVRWPGRVPAKTVSDQLVCNVDMLATFASLVNAKVPDGAAEDSVNVTPALMGEPDRPIRDELVLCPLSSKHIALRREDWVFIDARGNGGFTAPKPGMHMFGGPPAVTFAGHENSDIFDGQFKKDAPPGQLYNLADDPWQTRNLFAAKPEMVEQMRARLKQITDKPAATESEPSRLQDRL